MSYVTLLSTLILFVIAGLFSHSEFSQLLATSLLLVISPYYFFIEVIFTNSEMYRSYVHNSVSFDKCTHLHNCHLNQNTEHFYHPKFLMHPSQFPPPICSVMISITIDYFACVWTLYTQNHLVCISVCLPSVTFFFTWDAEAQGSVCREGPEPLGRPALAHLLLCLSSRQLWLIGWCPQLN